MRSVILLVALLALPLQAVAAPSLSEPRVLLPGSLPPHTAALVADAPADQTVQLVVALRLRDPAGLASTLQALQAPRAAGMRSELTDKEFADRFGPTAGDVAAVRTFLEAAGFAVTGTYPTRLLVDAEGTVADAQRAFDVALRLDAHGRRMPDRAPSVPVTLAPVVLSVMGLDTVQQLHPMHTTPRALGAAPADAYLPHDLAVAYNVTPLYARGVDGANQTIGIATAYDFKTADLRAFESAAGLPNATVKRTCVDGACHFLASAGSDETTLDVEYASAMAPHATVQVFEAHDAALATFTDVYAKAEASKAKVVSTSWGLCETQMAPAARDADEQIFAAAAAKGQTWFAASGDSGSADCDGATGVDYPASSPSVTGVGGTSLACARGPRCAGYGNETAWSGSGGGVSRVFAKPAWQRGSDAGRDVPDVSLTADPDHGSAVVFQGKWWSFGGTSEAAPQWAGIWALALQQKGGALGNANARLRDLADGRALHDVVSGCNGAFCASRGADLVTGLGSYDAGLLVASL